MGHKYMYIKDGGNWQVTSRLNTVAAWRFVCALFALVEFGRSRRHPRGYVTSLRHNLGLRA